MNMLYAIKENFIINIYSIDYYWHSDLSIDNAYRVYIYCGTREHIIDMTKMEFECFDSMMKANLGIINSSYNEKEDPYYSDNKEL